MCNRYIIIALALCITINVAAQKKRTTTKKPVAETTTTINPRIERMVQNTQRIVFIDSMLVPKSDMLNKIILTPQAGQITCNSQDFTYQNEIGTKRIFAKNNRLYTQQKAWQTFDEETELNGIAVPGVIDSLNCPFLMNDGQTLYFAAKGSESIGGYDIFVTRYNAETKTFLKPENIGMPFNSQADDLLFIIDEGSNIGYFATARRQPEGYVCIYTFIPSDSRQTYNELSYQQLERLADIRCIADTWGDGTQRTQALQRIKNIKPAITNNTPSIHFVINDQTVYKDITEFRSNENAERYQQLTHMQQQLQLLQTTLQEQRDGYEKAADTQRQQLRKSILDNEKKMALMQKDILQLEKQIRYSEIQLLK